MEQESQFISLYSQYFIKDDKVVQSAKVILSSIEQTMKESSQSISEQTNQQKLTYIFCSLLSILKTNYQNYSHQTTSSILFLLNFTIPQISYGVLQRTNIELQILLQQLFKSDLPQESKNNIQKYLLHVISKIIQALPSNIFTMQPTSLSIELIMECLTKESLTLRTLSCHIICKLLGMAQLNTQFIFQLQKFLLQQLQLPDSTALATCKSLQVIILNFPINAVYDIMYQLLRLFTLSQDFTLNTHILLIIEKIMANKQIETDVSENILKQFLENSLVIEQDEKFIFAFVQTLVQTLLQLNTFNAKKASKYIAACLSICSEIFFIGDNKFQSFAEKSMQMIISYTIRPNLWSIRSSQPTDDDQIFNLFFQKIERLELQDESTQFKLNKQQQQFTQFYKIVFIIKYLLSQRFDTVQQFSLNVVASFFEQLDNSALEFVQDIILTIGETRNKRPQMPFKKCFGTIIQRMGVASMNTLFPITFEIPDFYTINSENYESTSNLWLLPLYSKYIKKEPISTFVEIFYSLILVLQQRLIEFQNDQIKTKFFEFLIGQFWAIFPKCTAIPQKSSDNTLYQQQLERINYFLPEITSMVLSDLPMYIQKPLYQGTGSLFQELSQFTMDFSKQAEQMFPKLVQKLIITNPNAKIILETLNALAGACGREYLERVFGNNLKKIANSIGKEGQQNQLKTNFKTFDILLQIGAAMPNIDQFFDQILQFFLLANQLPSTKENHSLTKRTYKLLAITIQKMHYTYLYQIEETLSKTIGNVNSSYRYQRLLCTKFIWEYLITSRARDKTFSEVQESGVINDMTSYLQQFLPEIILTFNDKNHRTRKLSKKLFLILCNQMNQFQLLPQFAEILTAGLAGSNAAMRCCTIAAITLLLPEYSKEVEMTMKKVVEVIMILLDECNSEVYLSIVRFLTKFMQKFILTDQEVKIIFQKLLMADQKNRELHRSQVQHLIEKCLRKFGLEKMYKLVPEEQSQLVKYVEKERRKLKKKKQDGGERKEKVNKFLENMLRGEAEFQDDESDNEKTKNKNRMDMENDTTTIPLDDKNLLLKYDLYKDQFHFAEHPGVKQLEEIKKKEAANKEKKIKQQDVEFVDGKLVVRMNQNEEQFGKKRKRENITGQELEQKVKDIEKEENKQQSKPNQNTTSNKMNKKSFHFTQKLIQLFKDRKSNKFEEKQQGVHILKESGQKFKLKGNTPGDVQKQHQPSPYAFIQLNPKVLNKRYKSQGVKSFEVLMNVKQSGSFKGMKEKKIKKN